MPDKQDKKPSSGTRDARTLSNWWKKAKNFVIHSSPMYEISGNANANISENHIDARNAGIVFIMDRLAASTLRVDQREAQGSDRGENLPVAQGNRSEALQITGVQPQTLLEPSQATPSSSYTGITFESETAVEFTEPNVPSYACTTYSYTSRARTHIYSLLMLTHRAGYPLYMPTPSKGLPTGYRKKGIAVGDVGIITADGAFDFLFNICKSDVGNPAVLPDGSKPPAPVMRINDKFDSGQRLTSDHVKEIGDRNESSFFHCSAAEGAVLVLPMGATAYKVQNLFEFQSYASRNAISWYTYMLNTGRDDANGSLYLVTECTKSINWGIAVFYAYPTPSDDLRFVFDEGKYRWDVRGKIEARAGPKSNDFISSGDEEPNQCVFLRGFKIMLRPDIWDKLKTAISASFQDGEHSSLPSIRTTGHSPSQAAPSVQTDSSRQTSSNSTQGSSQGAKLQEGRFMRPQELPGSSQTRVTSQAGQVILEENFREEAPLHPSDLINLMLLHMEPKARVALVHDSAWCDHMPQDFLADPINPNVDGLLENVKRSRKVMIDEYESVVLLDAEMETTKKKKPILKQHNLDSSIRPLASPTIVPPGRSSSRVVKSSTAPVQATATLVPTTNIILKECPRFQILVVGRSVKANLSLVNAVFKANLSDVQRGRAIIDEGIKSEYNKRLVVYDYEELGNISLMEKFIRERSQERISGRLHAIWLCIPLPLSSSPKLDSEDERLFALMPIIAVYMERRLGDLHDVEQIQKKIKGRMPYVPVIISQPETLGQLVKITMQRMALSQMSKHLPKIMLAMAQRVDAAAKIDASILIGKTKYWSAIASGEHISGISLRTYLNVIHKDIIAIWNIEDSDELLLGDTFCCQMMAMVDDLGQNGPTTLTMTSGIPKWMNNSYQAGPEHIRCLTGYIVDLTLILRSLLQVSDHRSGGKTKLDVITEILYEFHCSEEKKRIHGSIRKFVDTSNMTVKENITDKIQSLIAGSRMKPNTHFEQIKPPLQALPTILRFELMANGRPIVNQIILDLVEKILDLPNYASIVSNMRDPFDVEALLDFMLYLLHNNSLSSSGIRDATRRARRLMFEMMAMTDVMPRSLFITDVRRAERISIGVGELATVYKGEHKGQQVTLKILSNGYFIDASLRKCTRREALVWRSVSHPYILPFLGVFNEGSRPFLVSPFMQNGTLTQWRNSNPVPDVAEIHRMVLEVAEGLQYLHTEGIVHGNVRGDNVLLDSSLHCRLFDFRSSHYYEDKFNAPVQHFNVFCAAPELLGVCLKCGRHQCYEHDEWAEISSMEVDVYAFGSLYYAIFFGRIPFEGKNRESIEKLLADGVCPRRFEKPRMEDRTWNLIQNCWKSDPSQRPEMKQIVEELTVHRAGNSSPGWHKKQQQLSSTKERHVGDATSADNVLFWTNIDPRESKLFNSSGVVYCFETIINADGKRVTTLLQQVKPKEEYCVAKFEWGANGGLGRVIIGKNILPMSDLVKPDPSIKGARIFRGPDGYTYRWRPSEKNSDVLLQDADMDEQVAAFLRPVKRTQYQAGDVYWELHLIHHTAPRKKDPPKLDVVTITAMLYRFCDAQNL